MTARTLIAGLEVFAVGIVESLSGQRVDREPDVDVLIVGAGPVGLTAAVEASAAWRLLPSHRRVGRSGAVGERPSVFSPARLSCGTLRFPDRPRDPAKCGEPAALHGRPRTFPCSTTLPILGRDGSLCNTERTSPAAGHVVAKAGTLAAGDGLTIGCCCRPRRWPATSTPGTGATRPTPSTSTTSRWHRYRTCCQSATTSGGSARCGGRKSLTPAGSGFVGWGFRVVGVGQRMVAAQLREALVERMHE